MNRGQNYRLGVGASSLLMVFVVLSLTVLGVLSLAAARADQKLGERNAESADAYYAAAAQVQRTLAQIDGQLALSREAADGDEAAYAALVSKMTIENTKIAVTDGTIAFSAQVDAARSIEVELAVTPLQDGARYRIVRHALTVADSWQPDEQLNLFGGAMLWM